LAVAARVQALTDDGSRVFFSTLDALVPEDVNEGPDIYEWHDGTVKLITSGTPRYPGLSGPSPVGVTAAGRDFFFLDAAKLTQQARDSALKLYDARIGGGFPPQTPPAPCEAEGCRGPIGAAPAPVGGGSAAIVGPGNPKRHRHRRHRGHRRRHRKHQRGGGGW
jgi:hypothetical protein